MTRDVATHLYFLNPKAGKPAIGIVEQGQDQDAAPTENRYLRVAVTVSDARDRQPPASLDKEGFELHQWPTAVTDFMSAGQVNAMYFPEVEALLESVTGGAEIHIFDHTLRAQARERQVELQVREAVRIAHNDYTPRSGPQRVRDLLAPEEAERWLAGRYGVYNVWRPINGVVENMPLGLCEAASLGEGELIATDLVYGDRVGEVYQVAQGAGQRWRYFSAMRPDEALVFKCFDSSEDGRARFTPHCAFKLPDAGPGSRPRESIEVRALVRFE